MAQEYSNESSRDLGLMSSYPLNQGSLKMHQCSFYFLETLFYKHTSYYQGIYSVKPRFPFS